MAFIAVAVGGGALVGAGAAIYGANKTAGAAKDAAGMQSDAANRATDVQLQMFDQNRADMAPWRNVGQGALYSLADYMGIRVPVDSTGQPVTGNEFTKMYSPSKSMTVGLPTTGTATGTTYLPQSDNFGLFTRPFDYNNWKDPGYDFRLNQGVNALDRSAAARGRLFSGAQGKALTEYGQNYGSNEFTNAYNRWRNNEDTLFNRLSSLAGTGQTATSQVGQWGQNTANSVGNNLTNAGNAMAQGYNNAAAARASGYTGVANSVNSGLNNYAFYNMMNTGGGYGGNPFMGAPPAPTQFNNGMAFYSPEGW